MKGGIIVEYETPEGKQKGIAYRVDQKPEFSNYKKVFLKEVNDYNWVLANPVRFAKPITNVKGKLSFWEYGLTEESYLNMVSIDANENFNSLPLIEL